jgi:membrane protein
LGVKSTISFVRAVCRGFVEHDVMSLAAAVAFYTVLSFAPLVLLMVTVGGFLSDADQSELYARFYEQLGPKAREVGEGVVSHARRAGSPREAWRWVLSLTVLVVSASLVFGQLQKSLNRIWGARSEVRKGFRAWLWKRVLSMGMVFAIMFILLVALVVSAVIEAFIPRGNEYVGRASVLFVSLVVTTLLFAAIYKVLPDVRIDWKEVWVGALTTALLFSTGKALVSFYLEHGGVVESYGSAAGALIAMLLWVYYSCIILFIGAEMTAQYDQARAGRRRARHEAALAAQLAAKLSGAGPAITPPSNTASADANASAAERSSEAPRP